MFNSVFKNEASSHKKARSSYKKAPYVPYTDPDTLLWKIFKKKTPKFLG